MTKSTGRHTAPHTELLAAKQPTILAAIAPSPPAPALVDFSSRLGPPRITPTTRLPTAQPCTARVLADFSSPTGSTLPCPIDMSPQFNSHRFTRPAKSSRSGPNLIDGSTHPDPIPH
ncbi:predicted protein [Streptomyces viridosporus ATCC 14672]|uniref:Predicted protein n=1 Tax=Streptomyces viridosporus (strain ATCC 14672 / DSM 40746 / JCM 4963 / KCTC 9882 / NRRL B-12104 / FH 1290) TaxID=566461 RepID=D6A4L4_STRV1|nr:predicted protein [Streptomyces viridosporus ATCC 14672]